VSYAAGLAELQRWFARVITHPHGVEAGLHAAQLQVPLAAVPVLPSSQLTAEARLDIYRTAYRARLLECLAEDYPALAQALGASTFHALCLDYAAQLPSHSPSLIRFGARMPAFCAQ
jgi:hypothetical protein